MTEFCRYDRALLFVGSVMLWSSCVVLLFWHTAVQLYVFCLCVYACIFACLHMWVCFCRLYCMPENCFMWLVVEGWTAGSARHWNGWIQGVRFIFVYTGDVEWCYSLPWELRHCWLSIRPVRISELSDEVLVWLSVWSKVQIVCIWSSWCHCIPKPHHLLLH